MCVPQKEIIRDKDKDGVIAAPMEHPTVNIYEASTHA
jgi:hypothetical protein